MAVVFSSWTARPPLLKIRIAAAREIKREPNFSAS
jgi:hypothetical protein